MGFTRTLRVAGSAVLAGAVLLGTGGTAVADAERNAQWPLDAQGFAAKDVWKVSTGKGVTVAVIDSGFRTSHQDLTGQFLAGKNYSDGKQNGTDSVPAGKDIRDHGTGMASLIAGHGHGLGGLSGIKGLAPGVKIIPLTVEQKDYRADEQKSKAIRYAVDHGAGVINMSYIDTDSSLVKDAINYAIQRDVVLVAGAGNDGIAEVNYPAAYPGVIGVGAVDMYGKVWGDSNYNSTVDLLAPGVNIPSAGAESDSSYRLADGTSDATAYVSAAVALLRAKFPNLTAGQIANRLVRTAGLPQSVKDAKLPDAHYGYGFIKPLAALTRDIPAGSKQGPLPMPNTSDSSSGVADTGAKSSDASPSASSTSTSTAKVAFITIGAVVVVGGILLLVLLSKRRNKNRGGGPGAPGGHATSGSPYGQQPPQRQNPYARPQPNPYQQPTQAPGQWPNQ